MSLIPIFSSPCDLASTIPGMIADFLESGQQIGKRFREETISDIIVASVLKLNLDEIVVLTPSESATGADFDLIVVEPTTGDAVQFRIQSKQLTPHHIR